MVFILYGLAAILLGFIIFTYLYQYVAALSSLDEVIKAFFNDRILMALWLSLLSAFVTSFIAIFLGVPLGYVLAMHQFRGKSLIETFAIDLPQTFPPVAEGMIFLLMLGPNSPFHINLAYTFIALVFAQFYVSAPFVVSFAERRFMEIRKTGLDTTARTLGANPFQVFTSILIPLAVSDIAAGVSLCWSRSMGELGGSLIFAGVIPFKTEVIPTFIATQSTAFTAGALAATILVTTASTIALVSFKRFTEAVK
jgi:ABC-type sulfate transport system permease component